MRDYLVFFGKYAIGGIISYVTPRALVAVGVPLDRWIVSGAQAVSIALSNDAALWVASSLIFLVLFSVLVYLDYRRPRTIIGGDTMVATGVLGPKPAPIKKQTAYERETRIRAVDALIKIIEEDIRPLILDSRKVMQTLLQRASTHYQPTIDEIARLFGASDLTNQKWFEALGKYGAIYPDISEAIKHEFDIRSMPGTIQNIRSEMVRIRERDKHENVGDYLISNIHFEGWQRKTGELENWADNVTRSLTAKRLEYEKAEVY